MDYLQALMVLADIQISGYTLYKYFFCFGILLRNFNVRYRKTFHSMSEQIIYFQSNFKCLVLVRLYNYIYEKWKDHSDVK